MLCYKAPRALDWLPAHKSKIRFVPPSRPASSLSTLALRVEPRSQILRDDRAKIVLPTKHPVANARNEIVRGVTQTARDHSENIRQNRPPASQPSHHVNRGVRAYQEIAAVSEYHERVWQSEPSLRRHAQLERLALQRSEPESISCAVVLQDKLHGAVAQTAVAIVEDVFGILRDWQHRKA